MNHSESLVDRVIDVFKLWLHARYIRSTGARIFSGGLALLCLSLGGIFNLVHADFQLSWGNIVFKPSVLPTYVEVTVLVLGAILTLTGAYLMLTDEHAKQKRELAERTRKTQLTVQLDALNDAVKPALADSLPARSFGQRALVTLDLRDILVGAHNLDLVASRILNVKQQIANYKGGQHSSDLDVYVGGLGPVPVQFALGNVIENEGQTSWADWNPTASQWVWPESGTTVDAWPMSVPESCDECIVLKAGITYEIFDEDARKAFPGLQILSWEPKIKLFRVVLNQGSLGAVTSEFENLLHSLQGRGVKKIHLLLACSSALCFRLGSAYDPRNMPELVVYQYERNSEQIYTWGLSVKAHEGKKDIHVEDRRPSTAAACN